MIERNEVNMKSKGGSELQAERLYKYVPKELTDQFQVTLSRVRDLDENKFRIYWIHDLPFDPELKHMSNQSSLDRFHEIVFCSQWQYNQFQLVHNIPFQRNIRVINSGIVPIEYKPRDNKQIRLIYTSTPQRGLEILIPVFDALTKAYPNLDLHLDVFSSFKIYGWDEADKSFEPLYKMCRDHPNITYHGFQPNEVVREYLQKAHILAYPSIWMECNSASIAEAMSAGCMVVAPNYGGIVDGTGALGVHYQWLEDKNQHAQEFYGVLHAAITHVQTEDQQNYLQFVKMYADNRYNITRFAGTWKSLMESVIQRNPPKSLRPVDSGNYFQYKTL